MRYAFRRKTASNFSDVVLTDFIGSLLFNRHIVGCRQKMMRLQSDTPLMLPSSARQRVSCGFAKARNPGVVKSRLRTPANKGFAVPATILC